MCVSEYWLFSDWGGDSISAAPHPILCPVEELAESGFKVLLPPDDSFSSEDPSSSSTTVYIHDPCILTGFASFSYCALFRDGPGFITLLQLAWMDPTLPSSLESRDDCSEIGTHGDGEKSCFIFSVGLTMSRRLDDWYTDKSDDPSSDAALLREER